MSSDTIHLKDFLEGEGRFSSYNIVMEKLSEAFNQSEEDLDYALKVAGNFDTLIMFCSASRDMKMNVREVADLSLNTTIPQMYLREIRPKGREEDEKPSASVVNFRRDRKC